MYILGMLSKVAPILLLIIMGFIFQRTHFLKEETITDLKKLVLKFSLPFLLYLSFSSMKLEGRYLFIVIAVFSACGLMLGFGILAKKILRQDNPYYAALFTSFEAGMMAYPLFIPVFGIENTPTVAIVQMGQTLFAFFVLLTYMRFQSGQSLPFGQQVVSLLKTPIIVAVLLGILASVSGFGPKMAASMAGGMIIEWMRLLSTLTVPVVVLVIGYELRLDLHDLKRLKMPLLTSLLRMSMMLMLAFLINTFLIDRLLHLDWIFQAAVYTIFLLPPPFVLPFFMPGAEEKHRQFVITTISVHIILSLLAYMVFILVM